MREREMDVDNGSRASTTTSMCEWDIGESECGLPLGNDTRFCYVIGPRVMWISDILTIFPWWRLSARGKKKMKYLCFW